MNMCRGRQAPRMMTNTETQETGLVLSTGTCASFACLILGRWRCSPSGVEERLGGQEAWQAEERSGYGMAEQTMWVRVLRPTHTSAWTDHFISLSSTCEMETVPRPSYRIV